MSFKNYNNDDISYIKDGDVEYLKFKILEKYEDKLKHCITLRHGGVSQGQYESLNFKVLDGESKENVEKNIDILCEKLKVDKERIYKGYQAHTDNILVLNEGNKEEYSIKKESKKEYDSYIYNESNISTYILTADCMPIIIYDTKQNVVANIHSGWAGTLKKIYMKTLEKLLNEFGCRVEDLIVCVGPSINKCCFTSSEKEFLKKFTDVFEKKEEYVTYEEKGNNEESKFHIDMPYLVKRDMLKIGIKEENIVLSNICTKCNHKDFFSYRYATNNGAKDCGRIATYVGIR